MTVYIVTPFHPDAIMEDELSIENKAVDCSGVTKIACIQGPGAYFCARIQGRDLVLTRAAAPFPNLGRYYLGHFVLVKVAYYPTSIARFFLKTMLVFPNYAHFNKTIQKLQQQTTNNGKQRQQTMANSFNLFTSRNLAKCIIHYKYSGYHCLAKYMQ